MYKMHINLTVFGSVSDNFMQLNVLMKLNEFPTSPQGLCRDSFFTLLHYLF